MSKEIPEQQTRKKFDRTQSLHTQSTARGKPVNRAQSLSTQKTAISAEARIQILEEQRILKQLNEEKARRERIGIKSQTSTSSGDTHSAHSNKPANPAPSGKNKRKEEQEAVIRKIAERQVRFTKNSNPPQEEELEEKRKYSKQAKLENIQPLGTPKKSTLRPQIVIPSQSVPKMSTFLNPTFIRGSLKSEKRKTQEISVTTAQRDYLTTIKNIVDSQYRDVQQNIDDEYNGYLADIDTFSINNKITALKKDLEHIKLLELAIKEKQNQKSTRTKTPLEEKFEQLQFDLETSDDRQSILNYCKDLEKKIKLEILIKEEEHTITTLSHSIQTCGLVNLIADTTVKGEKGEKKEYLLKRQKIESLVHGDTEQKDRKRLSVIQHNIKADTTKSISSLLETRILGNKENIQQAKDSLLVNIQNLIMEISKNANNDSLFSILYLDRKFDPSQTKQGGSKDTLLKLLHNGLFKQEAFSQENREHLPPAIIAYATICELSLLARQFNSLAVKNVSLSAKGNKDEEKQNIHLLDGGGYNSYLHFLDANRAANKQYNKKYPIQNVFTNSIQAPLKSVLAQVRAFIPSGKLNTALSDPATIDVSEICDPNDPNDILSELQLDSYLLYKKAFETGNSKEDIVMPTGTGKTVLVKKIKKQRERLNPPHLPATIERVANISGDPKGFTIPQYISYLENLIENVEPLHLTPTEKSPINFSPKYAPNPKSGINSKKGRRKSGIKKEDDERGVIISDVTLNSAEQEINQIRNIIKLQEKLAQLIDKPEILNAAFERNLLHNAKSQRPKNIKTFKEDIEKFIAMGKVNLVDEFYYFTSQQITPSEEGNLYEIERRKYEYIQDSLDGTSCMLNFGASKSTKVLKEEIDIDTRNIQKEEDLLDQEANKANIIDAHKFLYTLPIRTKNSYKEGPKKTEHVLYKVLNESIKSWNSEATYTSIIPKRDGQSQKIPRRVRTKDNRTQYHEPPLTNKEYLITAAYHIVKLGQFSDIKDKSIYTELRDALIPKKLQDSEPLKSNRYLLDNLYGPNGLLSYAKGKKQLSIDAIELSKKLTNFIDGKGLKKLPRDPSLNEMTVLDPESQTKIDLMKESRRIKENQLAIVTQKLEQTELNFKTSNVAVTKGDHSKSTSLFDVIESQLDTINVIKNEPHHSTNVDSDTKMQYILPDFDINQDSCSVEDITKIFEKTQVNAIIIPFKEEGNSKLKCKIYKSFSIDADDRKTYDIEREIIDAEIAQHESFISFFDRKNAVGGDYESKSLGINKKFIQFTNNELLSMNDKSSSTLLTFQKILQYDNRDRTPLEERDYSIDQRFIFPHTISSLMAPEEQSYSLSHLDSVSEKTTIYYNPTEELCKAIEEVSQYEENIRLRAFRDFQASLNPEVENPSQEKLAEPTYHLESKEDKGISPVKPTNLRLDEESDQTPIPAISKNEEQYLGYNSQNEDERILEVLGSIPEESDILDISFDYDNDSDTPDTVLEISPITQLQEKFLQARLRQTTPQTIEIVEDDKSITHHLRTFYQTNIDTYDKRLNDYKTQLIAIEGKNKKNDDDEREIETLKGLIQTNSKSKDELCSLDGLLKSDDIGHVLINSQTTPEEIKSFLELNPQKILICQEAETDNYTIHYLSSSTLASSEKFTLDTSDSNLDYVLGCLTEIYHSLASKNTRELPKEYLPGELTKRIAKQIKPLNEAEKIQYFLPQVDPLNLTDTDIRYLLTVTNAQLIVTQEVIEEETSPRLCYYFVENSIVIKQIPEEHELEGCIALLNDPETSYVSIFNQDAGLLEDSYITTQYLHFDDAHIFDRDPPLTWDYLVEQNKSSYSNEKLGELVVVIDDTYYQNLQASCANDESAMIQEIYNTIDSKTREKETSLADENTLERPQLTQEEYIQFLQTKFQQSKVTKEHPQTIQPDQNLPLVNLLRSARGKDMKELEEIEKQLTQRDPGKQETDLWKEIEACKSDFQIRQEQFDREVAYVKITPDTTHGEIENYLKNTEKKILICQQDDTDTYQIYYFKHCDLYDTVRLEHIKDITLPESEEKASDLKDYITKLISQTPQQQTEDKDPNDLIEKIRLQLAPLNSGDKVEYFVPQATDEQLQLSDNDKDFLIRNLKVDLLISRETLPGDSEPSICVSFLDEIDEQSDKKRSVTTFKINEGFKKFIQDNPSNSILILFNQEIELGNIAITQQYMHFDNKDAFKESSDPLVTWPYLITKNTAYSDTTPQNLTLVIADPLYEELQRNCGNDEKEMVKTIYDTISDNTYQLSPKDNSHTLNSPNHSFSEEKSIDILEKADEYLEKYEDLIESRKTKCEYTRPAGNYLARRGQKKGNFEFLRVLEEVYTAEINDSDYDSDTNETEKEECRIDNIAHQIHQTLTDIAVSLAVDLGMTKSQFQICIKTLIANKNSRPSDELFQTLNISSNDYNFQLANKLNIKFQELCRECGIDAYEGSVGLCLSDITDEAKGYIDGFITWRMKNEESFLSENEEFCTAIQEARDNIETKKILQATTIISICEEHERMLEERERKKMLEEEKPSLKPQRATSTSPTKNEGKGKE